MLSGCFLLPAIIAEAERGAESFTYSGVDFYSREPVFGPLRPQETAETAGFRDSFPAPILAPKLQVFFEYPCMPPAGERADMEKPGKEFVTPVHMSFIAGLFARNEDGG